MGVIRVLIMEHRIDASAAGSGGRNALHCITNSNCIRRWSMCLSRLVSTSKQRTSIAAALPSYQAATEGMHIAVLTLLNHGVTISKQNGKGNTPVHCAAANAGKWSRNVEVMDLLLRRGVDFRTTNRNGQTGWRMWNVCAKPLC